MSRQSLADFLRPHAIRTASPRPEADPPKRNQPPTPPPEQAKVERDKRPRTADEIETWRKSEQLGIDVQGVFDTRAFIGKSADGRTPKGALPWWWCYGHQPVHVPGAVYSDSDEGRHLVRGITEAAAQRANRDEFLKSIGRDAVPPLRLSRAKMKRGI